MTEQTEITPHLVNALSKLSECFDSAQAASEAPDAILYEGVVNSADWAIAELRAARRAATAQKKALRR